MLRTAYASLRVRLILLMLVVLVPALGLLVYVADKDRQNALDEVKSRALYLARLAAAEESQIVQSTEQLLQYLAQTPEARGETSRSACDAMMAQQIRLQPHYDNLGVVGPKGIRFCSVLLPQQSVDLSERTYFKRAVETRDFSVGDYQIGGSSGNASVGFGYPVLDASGALLGVVYATLNLKWLGNSLARAQLPPDTALSMVDSRGNVLARFPETDGQIGRPVPQTVLDQMLAQGNSGTFEGTGASGIRRVWGFVTLNDLGSGVLFVRVGIPISAAYGGINGAFYRNLLLAAAAALLIMAIAWSGGERLVMRPVRKLTGAAREMGKGDLGARTGLPHGHDEFGQLARAFDAMAASIQSEEAALGRLMEQQKEANLKLVAGMAELERLNGEITQLGRISNALRACPDIEEACATVVQSGRILFPAEDAALYLMPPSRSNLEYKAGWGGTGAEAVMLAPEACQALRRGQIFCYEPRHGELPCAHVTSEPEAAPYLCAPVMVQGGIVGLLHIRFPAPDGLQAAAALKPRLQLATTFAVQAGLALANLKLRDVLMEQSIRDPLTGLHNRRFLDEMLERELARAQRSKTNLALIMADVDHFKRFNDTYGHDAGDVILRAVAHSLKKHLRVSDIACRYGGEEFTLVLPESSLDAAREKAEVLRQAISALVLSHAGKTLGTVTMSFGLAIFPGHGRDAAGLLQTADKALYRAKSNGRNRVEVARAVTPVVNPRTSDEPREIQIEST